MPAAYPRSSCGLRSIGYNDFHQGLPGEIQGMPVCAVQAWMPHELEVAPEETKLSWPQSDPAVPFSRSLLERAVHVVVAEAWFELAVTQLLSFPARTT